jgi:hypothetical protein
MPACGHCGKDNPEGTAFCGYCANPLMQPVADPAGQSPKPGGRPIVAPQIRGGSPPPASPRPLKPETRTPPSSSGGGGGGKKGKGGFELLPWSELSSGQRAGRVAAGAFVLFLILFFLRGMLRGVGGSGASVPAPSADGSNAPITDGDRKDGIESLCKVFQIYGLPRNDSGANEAVHNAVELFKLAGNQSPERSTYILTSIVGDFRNGKLGQADCAQAGAPIPVNASDTPDNSSPDVPRN